MAHEGAQVHAHLARAAAEVRGDHRTGAGAGAVGAVEEARHQRRHCLRSAVSELAEVLIEPVGVGIEERGDVPRIGAVGATPVVRCVQVGGRRVGGVQFVPAVDRLVGHRVLPRPAGGDAQPPPRGDLARGQRADAPAGVERHPVTPRLGCPPVDAAPHVHVVRASAGGCDADGERVVDATVVVQ